MSEPLVTAQEQDDSLPHIYVTHGDMQEFRNSRVWLALNQAARSDMALVEQNLLSASVTAEQRAHCAGVIYGIRAALTVVKNIRERGTVDEVPAEQLDVELKLKELMKGVL